MRSSCFLLAAIFLIILSGCSNTNKSGLESSNYSLNQENKKKEGETLISSENSSDYLNSIVKGCSEIINRASNVSYSSLINKRTASEELFSKYLNAQFNIYVSSLQTNIIDVDNDFMIKCIRKVNDNHAYALYQTDDNRLFYIFFFYNSSEWLLSCTAVSAKRLTYNDFSSIAIGSDVKALEQIDPVTKDYYDRAVSSNMTDFTSKHLLNDGILIITYTKDSKGNYNVKSKDLYSDFKQPSGYDAVLSYYDYSILEQDFIK